MFYIKDILAERGLRSEIYVQHRDDRLSDRLNLIEEIDANPDDILLVHHSMGHDLLPLIEAIDCKKILVYHNITPPEFFEPGGALRHYAALGLHQLQDLRRFAPVAIADSAFNAAELVRRGYDSPVVIPLLRDFTEIRTRPFNQRLQQLSEPRYQLLFVGRICANKGQIHLVDFMKRYRDAFDHPLFLTLVGHRGDGERYADDLLREIARSGLQDRVQVTGHVSEEDLYGHYRTADAYVSFSEHEGFGVPLLEAMAFDLPVLAFDTAAIGGTLGTAGIRLATTSPEELAAGLRRLFTDGPYRRAVKRAQRRRLQDFARDTVAQALMAFLTPHLPPGLIVRDAAPASGRRGARARAPEVRRQYIVEGPCETSYSLALMNRRLADALDRRAATEAMLVPMEGVPGYVLDEAGVAANPEVRPLLEPLPLAPEATIVSVRNMYPLRPAGMLGDLHLAALAWEESEINHSACRLINRYLDGLLALTAFVRRVYRNSGISVPAVVCGLGIEHAPVLPRPARAAAPFVFLHVSSGLARKGIEELLLAYAAAFTRRDPVELVIKTHRNQTNVVQTWYDRVIRNSPNAPVVRIIFDDLDADQLAGLNAAADAVVLPSRGEGFNLPAAEAMAHGLPVIVTGYSGQMDFCSDENAWLVDYDFELSTSHLGAAQAMWVRARIDDLAARMRSVFAQRSDHTTLQKSLRGQQTVSTMTWTAASEMIKAFVDRIDGTMPSKKLKLGWVSTWNTRCGIATYSEFLVSHLPENWFDITIFSNHWDTLRPDSGNVVRNWTDRRENLDRLLIDVKEQGIDVVVFQYNYGFHTLQALADAVSALSAMGVDSYVFFHKTAPAVSDGELESIAAHADAFAKATRLVVHSVNDVNRLKQFGLVDNVVKIPHGVMRPTGFDPASVRRFLNLGDVGPVIGCYGFLLPPKGILELILAFSVLLGQYPDALLLLVNALHPAPEAEEELERCRSLIATLGLADRVIMITDFLEDQETHLLLQACDVIAFPYQHSGESASGAVRYGLSALRPVVTTPLALFDDVRDLVHQASGCSPFEVAEAIRGVLADPDLAAALRARQERWIGQHEWSVIAERFAHMVVGLYEDHHDVRVLRGAPAQAPAPRGDRAASTPGPTVDHLASLKDELFVQVAYRRLLRRDADPGGLAAALSALRDGLSRAVFWRSLSESAEGRAARGRAASGGRAEIIRLEQFEGEDDDAFVLALYARLLKRPSNEQERSAHLAFLRGGGSRDELVRSFLTSDEFITLNQPVHVQWTSRAPVDVRRNDGDDDL
ncbi:glycosyltransferase [Methylobacterium sp. CB376]|uniref:glycosyltransferase n=1 Tax=unclassified Methylobacterium TaxID=2615210 RepID=UPI002240657A|nr:MULTISPECIES: glycosyltransferase [Methylobacterium]WFT80313.1 glycosyltransferase [Methylobacterium nodulans]